MAKAIPAKVGTGFASGIACKLLNRAGVRSGRTPMTGLCKRHRFVEEAVRFGSAPMRQQCFRASILAHGVHLVDKIGLVDRIGAHAILLQNFLVLASLEQFGESRDHHVGGRLVILRDCETQRGNFV